MNNLQDFEVLPLEDIAICSVDGRLYTEYPDFCEIIGRLPRIKLTRELLHPAKCLEEGKDLFLPVHVSFLKHLTQIYYEQGPMQVLETVSNSQRLLLSNLARLVLLGMEKFNKVRSMWDPTISENNETVINRLSQARDWAQAPVRCLAWHTNIKKIAIAALDDSVRIYTGDSNFVPILKCKQQKNVTCLAWRSMSNSDLAVGCEGGVIVWNIDPNSAVIRPSTNHAFILHRIKHTAVMSISWSPRGDILATVSAHDSKILLWDVEMDRTSALKRAGGTGYSLVKWSPSGDRVFTASVAYIFRVWECTKWQVERWNVPSGRVHAACWGPDGRNLLFTTSEEPIIYALSFMHKEVIFKTDSQESAQEAVALYDVSKVEFDGVIVGGLVQSMDWDSRGNHVAVLFHDTNCVAVFNAISKPVIQLMPGFLISGLPEEKPNAIAFLPSFDQGSCLTIGWSSGRIQHFPIVYSDYIDTSVINDQANSFLRLSNENSSFYNH